MAARWQMAAHKPECRPVTRSCYCRGCDREIKRNTEDVIFIWSLRNKGQKIYLCRNCITSFHDMMGLNNPK